MSDTHLDNWLADLDRQGRSSHTLAAYRRGIKHLLRWNQATYGTPLDVRELLARDLRDWIACQQTVEHAALATIAQRHQALRSFCTYLVRAGVIQRDPTAEAQTFDTGPHEDRALGRLELAAYRRKLHAQYGARDVALVELLLGTGLRVGDMVLGERSGTVTVRRGGR